MPDISIGFQDFLLIVIPGFCFVWAFTGSKKGDLGHVIISTLLGILFLVLLNKLFPTEQMQSLLENPLAGTLTFSILAVFTGFLFRIFRFILNVNINL